MNWFVVTLTKDRLTEGESERLTKNFSRRMTRGHQPGFALFHLRDEGRSTTTYYLPPTAKTECPDLLMDFEFEETGKPTKESIAVAVGPEVALDHWYSEQS